MSDVVSRYVQLLSHEINNPLTVLCGQATLMRANLERQDVARLSAAITQVENNTNRVIGLIRELREALRDIPAEAAELTSLGELLAAAQAFVRRDFVARDVTLEVAEVPADLLVCVAPVAVRGVLWRLLARALDRGGPVRVTWSLGPRELKVAIHDAGPAVDLGAADLVAHAARLAGSGAALAAVSGGLEIHFPRVD